MTVFEQALAVLHADPNISSAAVWRSGDGGPPVSLRVVLSKPADLLPGLGGGARAVSIEAMVRGADLPKAPVRGDVLEVGTADYAVEFAEPDTLGASYRLGLSVA